MDCPRASNIRPLKVNTDTILRHNGFLGTQWSVEALCYQLEGHGFHSQWGQWIFHWLNPSSHIMVLGLTQPLAEMSTRNISLGVKAAGA